MSEVFIRDLFFDEAVDFALQEVSLFLVDEIVKITPRDLNRLPNNINRKDGKAPYRSSHYKPVQIWWNWYEWVTGMLKRSISHEKIEDFYFLIWVQKGPATKYAKYQEWIKKDWTILEYGSVFSPPRSFIRKWVYDNLDQAKKVFIAAIKTRLKL